MEFAFMDIFLHLDTLLPAIVAEYPTTIYALLFLIIFLETGLVLTPFLPGDSLLFAVGAFAATGALNLTLVFFIILIAAILGDTANYHIGKFVGPGIFKRKNSILFHKEHLIRTQTFYTQHGKKTIILARFIPIIRTFAPFVAGIGTMEYRRFIIYNILGAILWCVTFILGGFFLGNIPIVKNNFGTLIIVIIIISIIPIVKEVIVHVFRKGKPIS